MHLSAISSYFDGGNVAIKDLFCAGFYGVQVVPGAFEWSTRLPGLDKSSGGHGACMVHNPDDGFEDRNIPVGAAFWVALTERFLA